VNGNRIDIGSGQPDEVLSEARALIMALWEDRLDVEGGRRLEYLVIERAVVRQLYVRLIHQRCTLVPLLARGVPCLEIAKTSPATVRTLDTYDRTDLYDAMILPAIRDCDLPDDEEEAIESPPSLPRLLARPRWIRLRVQTWVRVSLVASVLVVAALIGRHLLDRHTSVPAQVATLVEDVEARWAGPVPGMGQAFTANAPLELIEGLCRLKFAQADVIVEAPARFTLLSENRIQLTQGKIWARANSASGFEVLTPSGGVKDLGTEFGVEVTPSQGTAVHVFQGSVAILSTAAAAGAPSAAPLVLSTGEAVVIDAKGTSQPKSNANPLTFVRPEQFAAALATGTVPDPYQRLLHDSSLVARFTFAEVEGKPAVNLLGSAVDALSRQLLFGNGTDARTIPTIVPGRRAGRTALYFDRTLGQRGRVPAEAAEALDFSHGTRPADALTVAAWVRASSAQSKLMSGCIVSRGLPNQKQYSLDVHSGSFRFYLRDTDGKDYHANSGFAPDDGWHLVAGTFDPASAVMKIYVDGTPRASTQGPRDLYPGNGEFRIGSRPADSAVGDIEYTLYGAIDEVMLWRRALSGEEIAALYRAGDSP
jgi:hypothetical protein